MRNQRTGRSSRPLAAAMVALWLVALAPQPARAEATSGVVDGVLTASGDDTDDRIQIGCAGDAVVVNQEDPGSGPAPCASITQIRITGGAGNDILDVSRVDPDAFSGLTSVTLSGGDGDDGVIGGSLDDSLFGGGGNDRLVPGGGADVAEGGGGSDAISVRSSGDATITDSDVTYLDGSVSLSDIETGEVRASDPLASVTLDASGRSLPITLVGSDGDDTLLGGDAGDTLSGGAGNDTLRGGAGDDVLDPGLGETDLASGGAGGDTLLVRIEGELTVTDRSVVGTGVAATLSRVEALQALGGAGDDRIDATAFSGSALVQGGEGDDVLAGGTGADSLAGGPGEDQVTGSDGDDRLAGDDGNDRLVAGAGLDSLTGGDGNDRLVGGTGDDRLSGDAGNDLLAAGPGDDQLDGGRGRDRCKGGPGTNRVLSC